MTQINVLSSFRYLNGNRFNSLLSLLSDCHNIFGGRKSLSWDRKFFNCHNITNWYALVLHLKNIALSKVRIIVGPQIVK